MAGNQVAYGAKKCESGLSAVLLRPCGPLALIPVNGEKKRNLGANSDRKMTAVQQATQQVFYVIRLSTPDFFLF